MLLRRQKTLKKLTKIIEKILFSCQANQFSLVGSRKNTMLDISAQKHLRDATPNYSPLGGSGLELRPL